jgi:hypothetical protein
MSRVKERRPMRESYEHKILADASFPQKHQSK